MTASFFAGRTVLVTGHTGFKGSWLCRWLSLMGARVVGFALPPESEPSLFELARLGESITSVIGDVRDYEAVRAVVEAHRPEIVLHLAAQALVRRSYREPVETFATNVMGTVHVLEACRKVGSVKAAVVVTSDKCYENREWVWGYREDEPMGGHDPYSASKGCAELVTAAYRRSFSATSRSSGPELASRSSGPELASRSSGPELAIASVRAGNVIGGGDFAEDRLIPDIVRGVAAGQPIVIRNPTSTRPWQHVMEPLSGYLLLAQRLIEAPAKHTEGWNFGPRDDDAIPALAIAERLIHHMGRGTLEVVPPEKRQGPHEARLLKLDTSKARALLGWAPRLDIERALEMTATWYRAWIEDPARCGEALDRQIREYGVMFE